MKKIFKMLALTGMCGALLLTACDKDNGGTEAAKWVDLGLPSGLLWATCNLGAASPEQNGGHYAWGETTTKSTYDWVTYKHCTVDEEGALTTLTKYNTSSRLGTPDNLTTLEAIDDAATQNLGGGARIPTAADWGELINNTTAEWTTMNSTLGRKFTAANGESIFLPAAGYRSGSEFVSAGSLGFYCSSSLDDGAPFRIWNFGFHENIQGLYYYYTREIGQSVRPVRSAR